MTLRGSMPFSDEIKGDFNRIFITQKEEMSSSLKMIQSGLFGLNDGFVMLLLFSAAAWKANQKNE